MNEHGSLRRIRKRRKRSKKLTENRELLASVVVFLVCGLVLTALITYLLSTNACHAPKFLQ